MFFWVHNSRIFIGEHILCKEELCGQDQMLFVFTAEHGRDLPGNNFLGLIKLIYIYIFSVYKYFSLSGLLP